MDENVSTTPETTPAPAATEIKLAPAPAPEVPSSTGWEGVEPADAGEAVFLDFLGKHGFGPDRPEVKAAQAGNFSLLEAALAQMGDKAVGYDKVLALAKDTQARIAKEHEARAQETLSILHDTFGGEEGFAEVKAWAIANGEPEELAYFNKAFAAGGIEAQAAAMFMQKCYFDAAGTEQVPKTPYKQERTTTTPKVTETGALSPKDYAAEVRKLAAQYGSPEAAPDKYKALQARRAMYRG